MPILLQIALGGALGASLRYMVTGWVGRVGGTAFPWGTLMVNVVGSFAMGVAALVLLRRVDGDLQGLAPFLMTGVLGGFTTFSAFSLEGFELIERGRADLAMLYMGASVALGLAAFAVPILLFRSGGGL